MSVFSCLGGLHESALHHIKDDKVRDYIKATFPVLPSTPLASRFPVGTDPVLLDFIHQLLCVDPDQRMTVQQALTHPYLSAFHCDSDEPVTMPIDGESMFAFETQKALGVDDFMELIGSEAGLYETT